MRDLVAGLFTFALLLLITVAPSWERTYGNSATAPTPTPLATAPRSAKPVVTPISRSFDPRQALATGPGFAICGSSDSWARPTLQEQTAHMASDPRYRDLRFDDNSFAAQQFRPSAVLYDGSGSSSRNGLVAMTGLWSDPRIRGTGCQTKEQQVWLFAYAPDSYEVIDGATAALNVHSQPGYRMVVITGEPRHSLVVVDGQRGMKLELLTTPGHPPARPRPLPELPDRLELPPHR